MNQEQQFLVKNLQNMISYIKSETEKKVKTIRSESDSQANAREYIIKHNNLTKLLLNHYLNSSLKILILINFSKIKDD